MRTCDGIFSANFAAAWLTQQGCRIFSMTAFVVGLADFFRRSRKFSGLPLDNVRASEHEKNSARGPRGE
jgi:hypothetical protein